MLIMLFLIVYVPISCWWSTGSLIISRLVSNLVEFTKFRKYSLVSQGEIRRQGTQIEANRKELNFILILCGGGQVSFAVPLFFMNIFGKFLFSQNIYLEAVGISVLGLRQPGRESSKRRWSPDPPSWCHAQVCCAPNQEVSLWLSSLKLNIDAMVI